MSFQLKLSAIAALVLLAAGGSQAATLLSDTSTPFARGDDTSFSEAFTSQSAGLANLSFAINGFGSLDGDNFYEDDFTLSLNGAAIFSGTFNLGGGGNDVVFLADPSATVNDISGNGSAVTWTGGQVNISTPLMLVAGSNTLSFGYNSLTTGHAGPQSLSDEGWDASNIAVTQQAGLDPVGVVPEPASWALMMTGFRGRWRSSAPSAQGLRRPIGARRPSRSRLEHIEIGPESACPCPTPFRFQKVMGALAALLVSLHCGRAQVR